MHIETGASVNRGQSTNDQVDYKADNEANVNTNLQDSEIKDEIQDSMDRLRGEEENRHNQQAEREQEQAPDMSWESWMEYELERIREDEELEELEGEVNDGVEVDQTTNDAEWFPFNNKMVNPFLSIIYIRKTN